MSHRRISHRNSSSLVESIERRILFAASFSTLASFNTYDIAQGATVVDSKGDIFGTTQATGNAYGTLYELPAGSNTIRTITTFDGNNGSDPGSLLTMDANGDIYGTTAAGGTSGYGTVWELPASATNITRIASFSGVDGNSIGNGLAMQNGNIYVVAEAGANGNGALLEIPAGATSFTTIATFNAGSNPVGRPVIDSAGDIFGVTATGGDNGAGSLWEITASGSFQTVASFIASDPTPQGDLLIDSAGNIYGTTVNNTEGQTVSTVFEIPAGSASINTLTPRTSTDGTYIEPGLVRDSRGDIFGSVTGGVGDPSAVFELPFTNGTFSSATTIATIPEVDNDGSNTVAATGSLALDSYGNLYGTTESTNPGSTDTLFEIAGAGAAQAGVQLVINQQPSKTVVDDAITPPITVDVLDSNNNLVLSDDSAVSVRISNGPNGATLGGTLTVDAVNGVATFSNLNLNTIGTYTLTFTAPNLSSATTTTFNITKSPLDGSHLVFTRPPTSGVAGQKLSEIIVTAELPSNAPSTKTKGTVTLSITSGPTNGKLLGTKTASLKQGIATFKNISFDIAGTYTLEAQDTASIAATPSTFDVIATTPKKMTFSQQPVNKIAPSSSFSVAVQLLDKYGNISTEDFSSVTIALVGGPKLADLQGTLTEDVVDGIAAFDDLSLITPGHYMLMATDAADKLKVKSKGFTIT